LAHSKVGIPIEAEIWAVVLTYYAVKHGLRKLASKLMIHRGISHSIPTLAVWVLLVYLHYPSDLHQLRVAMAVAVGLGVLSHLVLDEMFSVDLRNNHIKRSFGTALKLWSQSIWSTLGIYVLLSYLVWTSLEQWPNEPISNLVMQPIPAPRVPWPETKEGIDQVIQAKRDALEQAMRASKLPLPRLQLPSPGQPR
jgi:hypothetical protein